MVISLLQPSKFCSRDEITFKGSTSSLGNYGSIQGELHTGKLHTETFKFNSCRLEVINTRRSYVELSC